MPFVRRMPETPNHHVLPERDYNTAPIFFAMHLQVYCNTPPICIAVLSLPEDLRKGKYYRCSPHLHCGSSHFVAQDTSHLHRNTSGKTLAAGVTRIFPTCCNEKWKNVYLLHLIAEINCDFSLAIQTIASDCSSLGFWTARAQRGSSGVIFDLGNPSHWVDALCALEARHRIPASKSSNADQQHPENHCDKSFGNWHGLGDWNLAWTFWDKWKGGGSFSWCRDVFFEVPRFFDLLYGIEMFVPSILQDVEAQKSTHGLIPGRRRSRCWTTECGISMPKKETLATSIPQKRHVDTKTKTHPWKRAALRAKFVPVSGTKSALFFVRIRTRICAALCLLVPGLCSELSGWKMPRKCPQ